MDPSVKSFFKKIIVAILTWEAKVVLSRQKPRVVAITGSVGKTSAKDAIYTVLSSEFFVRKSDKSFNSEIGIPLTILGLKNGWSSPLKWIQNILEGLGQALLHHSYPEWLVLEVGADRPGDIRSIARWLRPDVVVVTHVPHVPVHVEFFPTPEALLTEKRYLAEALKPEGTLILNADDERVAAIPHPAHGKIVRFGMGKDADVRASKERVTYKAKKPTGISFKVAAEDHVYAVTLPGVLGVQHVYPALAAIAVGRSLSLDPARIEDALSRHLSPPGRMRILPGIRGSVLIDDTYNASPVAVAQALHTLHALKTEGRRIAVLADMLELGSYSIQAHADMGKIAAEEVDTLITVGIRSHEIGTAALKAGMKESNIEECATSQEAGKVLEGMLQEGDIALIKGSQSMRMEWAVEEVMAHPEDKDKLLVRQDPAWRRKI
jgi:UDP-N-acetylmuramoyl-tripeptide--D-alanyl-D-alanine ligase